MNEKIEDYIGSIIQSEMILSDIQVVMSNQNFLIPNDNSLYIFVSVVDTKFIANRNRYGTESDGLVEYQEVVMRENVQIDIISASDEARLRRYEIVMALASIKAKQTQENNNFKIGRIPTSFVNSSSAEGGSILNRYTIVVPVLTWERKDKRPEQGADYYNDFDTRVDTEETINQTDGIIEFSITE